VGHVNSLCKFQIVAFNKDNTSVISSCEACVVVEQDREREREREREIKKLIEQHHLTGLICVSHRNNRQAFS